MSKHLKLIFALVVLVTIGLTAAGKVQAVQIPNPLKALQSFAQLPGFIGGVVNMILSVIGAVALVVFIYGGITWMISGGRPEMVKKGRDAMVWGVFGLAIIFFSYAIIHFVIRVITAGGG